MIHNYKEKIGIPTSLLLFFTYKISNSKLFQNNDESSQETL